MAASPPPSLQVRARRARRGANAVEFALCMPIWVMVVIAIIDFGWVFFQATSLDAATNLGCRAGSLVDPGENDANLAQVQSVATNKMMENLTLLESEVCIECGVTASTTGDPPQRTLVCEAQREISPIIGLFVDTEIMHSTQTARLEWQRSAAPD